MTPTRLILVALLAVTGAGLSGLLLLEHHGGISPDGRYVAFSGQASNLVSGGTNGGGDVFIRDRYGFLVD